MKRVVRILAGVLVAHIGFVVTAFFLMFTGPDIGGYFDYRQPDKFFVIQATVTSAVDSDGDILLLLDDRTCLGDTFFYDGFILRDKSRRIALKNGLPALSELEGVEITVMANSAYLGDGWRYPIAALSVDGVEYLSFTEGYPIVRRQALGACIWAVFLCGGSLAFFTWATVRLIRGKKESPPKLPYFRLKPFQKLPPKD